MNGLTFKDMMRFKEFMTSPAGGFFRRWNACRMEEGTTATGIPSYKRVIVNDGSAKYPDTEFNIEIEINSVSEQRNSSFEC